MSAHQAKRFVVVALAALALSTTGCQAVRGLFGGLLGGGGGGLGGLLGGGGSLLPGPLGAILTIIQSIPPPPNPIESEFSPPTFVTSPFKVVFPTSISTQISGTLLASIVDVPVAGARGPDGFIYYTEKASGRIRKLDPTNGGVAPDIILDLPVNNSGRRGLNGIAFAPDGSRVFVTYVRANTSTDTLMESEALEERVSSFPWPNPTLGAETVLWTGPVRDPLVPIPTDINGIATCNVGPDGKLYFSHGDYNNRVGAQDNGTFSPAGKVHRINLDGTIPDDNVFPGNTVWANGFRDPFGFTFDSTGGTLWLGDRGSSISDELNIVTKGQNYGWPQVHGTGNTDFEAIFTIFGAFVFREPVVDFAGIEPQPGLTSVAVVRGNPYGDELEGNVLYAHSNLPSKVTRIAYSDSPIVLWSDVWFAPDSAGRVIGLVARTDGRIIALCQNAIYRLDPAP